MNNTYVPRFQHNTAPQPASQPAQPASQPAQPAPQQSQQPRQQQVDQSNPQRRRPLTIQQEQQRSLGAMVAAGAPVEHLGPVVPFLKQPLTLDDQRQRFYGGLTILGFPVSRVAVFEDATVPGGYRLRVFVSPDRCKREGITPSEETVILFGRFLVPFLCQPGTEAFNIYGGIGRQDGEDYVGLEFVNLKPAFVLPLA